MIAEIRLSEFLLPHAFCAFSNIGLSWCPNNNISKFGWETLVEDIAVRYKFDLK
jgi:hypothetical protein